MVETYGLDECVDAGQLLRGYFAELRGWDLLKKDEVQKAIESVILLNVTDAKDSFDRVTSDKNSLGTRRSLALTMAWLKQQFRQRNVFCRWTDTSNMLADPLTKGMDATHLVKMLERGTWAVTYCYDFIKTKASGRGAAAVPMESRELLPGRAATSDEVKQVEKLSETCGWSRVGAHVFQVARDAKAFRTPEPRFSSGAFPLRSTFGQFLLKCGKSCWQRLEAKTPYLELKNQHASLPAPVQTLVSMFSAT